MKSSFVFLFYFFRVPENSLRVNSLKWKEKKDYDLILTDKQVKLINTILDIKPITTDTINMNSTSYKFANANKNYRFC